MFQISSNTYTFDNFVTLNKLYIYIYIYIYYAYIMYRQIDKQIDRQIDRQIDFVKKLKYL